MPQSKTAAYKVHGFSTIIGSEVSNKAQVNTFCNKSPGPDTGCRRDISCCFKLDIQNPTRGTYLIVSDFIALILFKQNYK